MRPRRFTRASRAIRWPAVAAVSLVALPASAHGDSLARGILLALVLVGLAGLLGLGALGWTVALIVRVRRGAGERDRRRCRRMGVACSILAVATLLAFFLTGAGGDSLKLLPCALVLGAVGVAALRAAAPG